jgi:CHAT domain-containing protein
VSAEGPVATCQWVRDNVKDGSALHFACHAFGALLDSTRSGFVLADGHISGPDVARLGPLGARLAVASACQSGVIGIGDLADEALSLGSALLAAGAACSIASLWRVDDLATAILMTRLYEELRNGLEPPAALAASQRWLRDLREPDRRTFLLRHPVLASHERVLGIGTNGTRTRVTEGVRPYAHPRYWAAFVAMGA